MNTDSNIPVINFKDSNIEKRWNDLKQQFKMYILTYGYPEKIELVKIALLHK